MNYSITKNYFNFFLNLKSHVPNYEVDWQVNDEEYYIDYGQTEIRDHDNTKTNWWVTLPGYSHIRRKDAVNAQAPHTYSQGYESSKPIYKTEYKPNQYKEEYTPTQYKESYKQFLETEHKPVHYKEESIKPTYKTQYKPIQYKEEYKPANAGYRSRGYKMIE